MFRNPLKIKTDSLYIYEKNWTIEKKYKQKIQIMELQKIKAEL